MTALCGWLLALVLVAPQAGDDETRDRRESIRTRRLYDLINEKVATDARNTNLVETDDLTFYDLSPLQGETLQGSDGNSITGAGMCARQYPATHLSIDRHLLRGHGFNVGRDLPIP